MSNEKKRNQLVMLSAVLTREREKKKLKREQLAKILSIPYSTIWDWENLPDRGIDDLDRLYVLSEYFEISVGELLYGKDEEKDDLKTEVDRLRKLANNFELKYQNEVMDKQLSFEKLITQNSELELENERLRDQLKDRNGTIDEKLQVG